MKVLVTNNRNKSGIVTVIKQRQSMLPLLRALKCYDLKYQIYGAIKVHPVLKRAPISYKAAQTVPNQPLSLKYSITWDITRRMNDNDGEMFVIAIQQKIVMRVSFDVLTYSQNSYEKEKIIFSKAQVEEIENLRIFAITNRERKFMQSPSQCFYECKVWDTIRYPRIQNGLSDPIALGRYVLANQSKQLLRPKYLKYCNIESSMCKTIFFQSIAAYQVSALQDRLFQLITFHHFNNMLRRVWLHKILDKLFSWEKQNEMPTFQVLKYSTKEVNSNVIDRISYKSVYLGIVEKFILVILEKQYKLPAVQALQCCDHEVSIVEKMPNKISYKYSVHLGTVEKFMFAILEKRYKLPTVEVFQDNRLQNKSPVHLRKAQNSMLSIMDKRFKSIFQVLQFHNKKLAWDTFNNVHPFDLDIKKNIIMKNRKLMLSFREVEYFNYISQGDKALGFAKEAFNSLPISDKNAVFYKQLTSFPVSKNNKETEIVKRRHLQGQDLIFINQLFYNSSNISRNHLVKEAWQEVAVHAVATYHQENKAVSLHHKILVQQNLQESCIIVS